MPPEMSPIEVAAGEPIGLGPEAVIPTVATSPMATLEEIVRETVRLTPCCVAFSGGRDSSLVLAAAVRAARREGVAPPIAVTLRFPSGSEADERTWQDLVLDHLGVEDLIAIDVTEELDYVGSLATRELLRRGILFPSNIHSLTPLLPQAAGGSLLVGVGGDELLGTRRWSPLNDLFSGRRRPEWSDTRRLLGATLPARLRGRIRERRNRDDRPWLRPRADKSVNRLEARVRDEPVRFDKAIAHQMRRRVFRACLASLERLGQLSGVHIQVPVADPRFVASLARAGGARGWSDRAATMRAIATGVLPDALLDRRDKAIFNASFYGEATLRFAEEWSGEGVDTSLVDPEALRRAWLEREHQFRTALLLQIAWLHDHGSERVSNETIAAPQPAPAAG